MESSCFNRILLPPLIVSCVLRLKKKTNDNSISQYLLPTWWSSDDLERARWAAFVLSPKCAPHWDFLSLLFLKEENIGCPPPPKLPVKWPSFCSFLCVRPTLMFPSWPSFLLFTYRNFWNFNSEVWSFSNFCVRTQTLWRSLLLSLLQFLVVWPTIFLNRTFGRWFKS